MYPLDFDTNWKKWNPKFMMPRIGKEQEIENEFFEHEQDENDTADEYMIT